MEQEETYTVTENELKELIELAQRSVYLNNDNVHHYSYVELDNFFRNITGKSLPDEILFFNR